MTPQQDRRGAEQSQPLKVFISYSRSDVVFADRLVAALEARGLAASIDKADLPTLEDWQRELMGLIRAADAIVFIITETAVNSSICVWEVQEAVKLNKRLAPIVLQTVPDSRMPPELSRINYLSFETPSEFDAQTDRLATALLTDVRWVKEHTRFGELARRWDERGRRGPPPLRGQDLHEAERWIGSRPREAPLPTASHRQLIEASRRAATHRQRIGVAASLAAAVIALSLAGIAYWQRDNAVSNATEAATQRDRALVAQSRFLADMAHRQSAEGDSATAMALALEALPDAANAQQRPYAPEAEVSLYESVIGVTETAVLAHHVSAGGLSWSGPEGAGQDVTSSDEMVQYALDRLPLGTHMFASMGGVRAVFSNDGTRIVTWGNDGARIWEANTGRELAYLHPHELGIVAAAMSPDGSRLVTAFPDQTAHIWSTSDWSELTVLRGHSALLTTVGFSPDGSRIVTGSWDSTARLWNASTGRQEMKLDGHSGGVTIAFFNRDGSRIITGGDKTVRVWDASTGAPLAVLSGHTEIPQSVQMSPDGKLIATAAHDGTARLWDAATGTMLGYLAHDGAASVDFSPDGTRVVVAAKSGMARIIETRTGAEIAVLRGHARGVLSAAYSPSGAEIVTASNDGSARLWDAQTGSGLRVFDGHERGVFGAVFSPDGGTIVTMSFDGTARLWKTGLGEFVSVYHGGPEIGNSSSPGQNAGRVLKINDDHSVRVVDAQTGAELAILQGHKGTVFGAAFSADGSRVVTASYDATARVWDSRSGREIAVLSGHHGSVLSAAFSLDGARAATGSSDGTARIWDLGTRATVAIVKSPGYEVSRVGFGSDGKSLITARQDGEGHVWRYFPDTQSIVDAAKASIPRCLTREQRRQSFLDQEPPRWCITGTSHEQDVDANRWIGKWPYQTRQWKDWLVGIDEARKSNRPRPAMPKQQG